MCCIHCLLFYTLYSIVYIVYYTIYNYTRLQCPVASSQHLLSAGICWDPANISAQALAHSLLRFTALMFSSDKYSRIIALKQKIYNNLAFFAFFAKLSSPLQRRVMSNAKAVHLNFKLKGLFHAMSFCGVQWKAGHWVVHYREQSREVKYREWLLSCLTHTAS